jgi:RNA polymerase sigma factor for flagellar operon FliA
METHPPPPLSRPSTGDGAPPAVRRRASPLALKAPPTTEEQKRVSLGLPMVQQCADELVAKLRGSVRRETLLGPGTLGLYDAARNYRAEEHPGFAIYARHYIFGEMLQALSADNVPLRARVERMMLRAYERFAAHQTVEGDLFDDPEEKILDGNRVACDDALAAAFFAGILEAQGSTPEEILAELEGQVTTFEMIRDALDTLLPVERQVIHLVYYEKLTLGRAAAETDVSESTAQRRHAQALRKLRAFLVWRGVTDPRLLHF